LEAVVQSPFILDQRQIEKKQWPALDESQLPIQKFQGHDEKWRECIYIPKAEESKIGEN